MQEILSDINTHQDSIKELERQKEDLERKIKRHKTLSIMRIEACEKRQKLLKKQVNDRHDRRIQAIEDEREADLEQMESRHREEMENLVHQENNTAKDYTLELSEIDDLIIYHNESAMLALNIKFGVNGPAYETTGTQEIKVETKRDAGG